MYTVNTLAFEINRAIENREDLICCANYEIAHCDCGREEQETFSDFDAAKKYAESIIDIYKINGGFRVLIADISWNIYDEDGDIISGESITLHPEFKEA